jgi:hypothetical protein
MPRDHFEMRARSITGPAVELRAVEPSDSADLPNGVCRSLFAGGAGVIVVQDAFGSQVSLHSGASQYHPVQIRRVLATGTTATDIIALY